MKITITREIDVPNNMTCVNGRNICSALTDIKEKDMRVCSNFNQYLWWSDKAGYFLRCPACIEAQRKYLETNNE